MSTYNDSTFVSYSVKSILNQTFKDFEFLIIDDGSSDNTDEILSKFNDSRIVYKKISHTGLAGALNFGLQNSTGDWIARIDADDLNDSNRLKTQLDFHNTNPQYDVIGSWSAYFNLKNQIQFILRPPAEDKEIKTFLNLHNPLNHSSVFFSKDKILSEGGYDESYESYEDFELWFRLKNKLKFKIMPEVLVYTLQRKDSLTKISGKNKIYGFLYSNASENLNKAKSAGDKRFWNNILFWIEYFYGLKSESRKYYTKDITFRKSLAYINTFLSENTFEKIVDLRLRYRMQTKLTDKEKYKKELEKLISL
ncbi:MAG: glycosyltransferase [Ignavibacteriaceae bacterium]